MRGRISYIVVAVAVSALAAPVVARADGLLFNYEGDILPGDPGSGFVIADPCEVDCSRHLDSGYFVLEWGPMGNLVNYDHEIARSPEAPPPTLWVEWRFRSNQPKPPTSSTCDAFQTIVYVGIGDIVNMFQDAAVDNEGGDFVLGLSPDFHTYRFESLDGENYTFAVDGFVFNVEFDGGTSPVSYIQFGGLGSCAGIRPQPVRNEWDFIRYGTIKGGEQVVSVDPPAGTLAATEGAQFDRFTMTFDQPAYLYIDDITVTTTGGTPPTVTATRRLDNGAPEVLEVLIDGYLPPGETTTFSFDTGSGPQNIEFAVEGPDIPATSTWGVLIMGLLMLVVGASVLRGRALARPLVRTADPT